MGIRVGMPILKLSASGQSTKRKGNSKKIAEEAGNERYSKDQDLDRSRSILNEYTGFKSGKSLSAYWDEEAGKHTDAMGRKLRSDAVIGYSLIVKPDMGSMESMTEDEQLRFCRDGMTVASQILNENGLQVDMTALHRDELVPHVHILGHDTEYKAGKKINIKLYSDFNKEFPKRMRELGYDVEDMSVYDADATKGMTDDEKAAYKENHVKRKASKKTGRSSNQYKAEKIAEQERAAAQILENAKLQAEAMQADVKASAEQLRDADEKLKSREAMLKRKEQALSGREASLQANERTFQTERDNFTGYKEKWLKTQNTALQEQIARSEASYADAKKACDELKLTYEFAKDDYEHVYIPAYQGYTEYLRQETSKKTFSNGRTLWDFIKPYVDGAENNAVKKAKFDMTERDKTPIIQVKEQKLSDAENRVKSTVSDVLNSRKMPDVDHMLRKTAKDDEYTR